MAKLSQNLGNLTNAGKMERTNIFFLKKGRKTLKKYKYPWFSLSQLNSWEKPGKLEDIWK